MPADAPPGPPEPPEHEALARLGRPVGLEGALRVHPRDDAALQILRDADEVHVEGLGPSRIEELRPHGRHWLVRLARVRHVDRARGLVHARLWADAAAPAAGDATPADPSGLPVWVDGERWGEVTGRDGGPANPLFRVRGATGTHLLPLTAPYVRVEADAVRVDDPPAGLLDDDPDEAS